MRGVSALESLPETQKDPQLRVFVSWEPVLVTDMSAPSTTTLRPIHDRRAAQCWDRNRVLSHLMGEQDRASVVWDYVAVYKPGQIWTEAPPQPEFKGSPAASAVDGTRQALRTIYSEASLSPGTMARLSLALWGTATVTRVSDSKMRKGAW